ncbi:MAG TPA: CHAT domain-containing protein [Trebonia sp.]|nr:CHAT domain-containing protein [Trebonia sp.]
MQGRRVLLAEYAVVDGSVLLFGVRADWDEPQIAVIDVDWRELERFAQGNFGSSDNVLNLVDLGLQDLWHSFDGLIAPLGTWADPEDIICLVPHGCLHYLPLHALKVDGRYLAERNPVTYSPSTGVLKHCLSRRATTPAGSAGSRQAAVFGDSRENLPAAREEASQLAALLGATPVIGPEVTRERLLHGVADADFVHIAGHAFFSGDDPLESGLQLAGGDILTAAQIFGWQALNASLVTLSGCETGVSANHPGDELIGLVRAFLYARASAVLVSLWPVRDKSTAFLMRRFYERMLADPTVLKADALRHAMLDTMSQPGLGEFYHWASFVLIGDWH